MTRPTPFTIHVPQEELDDLAERLARTRWADDFANESWAYGVEGGYLRELVDHWRHRFDWRTVEARMNTGPSTGSSSTTSRSTTRTCVGPGRGRCR